MQTNYLDTRLLATWFSNCKRDLPWRHSNDPYAIWVSEIMLQQTQVSVVIPYYLRWMDKYPTIVSLAEAECSEVFKIWEGLGYYSRARNLHEGARYIVKFFNGVLPNKESELSKIKGLGPYTVGAILSFAFHQKKAAVDGNVLRVLSRYFQLEDDIAKQAAQKKIRRMVEEILPEEESWVVNEALIELGATICGRKPKCHDCPLSDNCLSRLNGTTEKYPLKSKGAATTNLYRSVAILKWNEFYLIKKGEKGAVMADLYEFPFIEHTDRNYTDSDFLQKTYEEYRLKVELESVLPEVTHSFTRYKAYLKPYLLNVIHQKKVEGYEWLSLKDLIERPFSSGHRRILGYLMTSTHST